MISYVDFYRPKFFLLENVLGILEWRGNMVTANGRTNGGVEMGALKFVIRSMTSLGYVSFTQKLAVYVLIIFTGIKFIIGCSMLVNTVRHRADAG